VLYTTTIYTESGYTPDIGVTAHSLGELCLRQASSSFPRLVLNVDRSKAVLEASQRAIGPTHGRKLARSYSRSESSSSTHLWARKSVSCILSIFFCTAVDKHTRSAQGVLGLLAVSPANGVYRANKILEIPFHSNTFRYTTPLRSQIARPPSRAAQP
jgi:hypothetical protein